MEADGLARGLFLLSIVLPGNILTAKNVTSHRLANSISLLFSHLAVVGNRVDDTAVGDQE